MMDWPVLGFVTSGFCLKVKLQENEISHHERFQVTVHLIDHKTDIDWISFSL